MEIGTDLSGDAPNNAIGTLSKLFGDIVALVDHEILVEDLEDLAALEICHVKAATWTTLGDFLY